MKKILFSLLLALPGIGTLGTSASTLLTQGHIDLVAVEWEAEQPNPLQLVVEDEAHGVTYQPQECIVVCPESMKMTLPGDSALGQAGDTLWVLPQNHYDGVPFLGICAEEIPSGLFKNEIQITLTRVEGPGAVMIWQSSYGIDLKIDSREGGSAHNSLSVPAASHAHYNWGFSESGVYTLYFQACATLAETGETFTSPEAPYTFHILPLPELTPFEQWQLLYWSAGGEDSLAQADPDGDGLPNAVEYATGTHPLEKTLLPPLTCKVATVPETGKLHAQCTFHKSPTATDCTCEVVKVGLDGTAEEVLKGSPLETDSTVTLWDPLPLSSQKKCFYRLRVTLL